MHQASLDPTSVADEARTLVSEHFTPAQVMEIVLVTGFWKMYNTMHSAMAALLKDAVANFAHWVTQVAPPTERS